MQPYYPIHPTTMPCTSKEQQHYAVFFFLSLWTHFAAITNSTRRPCQVAWIEGRKYMFSPNASHEPYLYHSHIAEFLAIIFCLGQAHLDSTNQHNKTSLILALHFFLFFFLSKKQPWQQTLHLLSVMSNANSKSKTIFDASSCSASSKNLVQNTKKPNSS